MNRKQLLMGVGACAIVGSFACNEEHPILTDPIGKAAFGYQLQQLATNLPRGSARFKFQPVGGSAIPDSITLSISGLDSLTGNNFYTAWAGDSLGATWKRITGTLLATRTDSTLDAVGNTLAVAQPQVTVGAASAIQNGSTRTAYQWRFARATSGLTAADSMQTLLITIEASATAATPDLRRAPIFARRGEGGPAAGVATSTLRFGNWGPTAADQYLYIPASSPRGRGVFWGDILEITDSVLPRAPLGFYYAVFAIKGVPVGSTGGDTLYVGELTSPAPRRNMSLYNSDSAVTDPLVVVDLPREILAGAARISADTVTKLLAHVACPLVLVEGENRTCPYKGYTEVRTTLQLKSGTTGKMSAWRVLGAAVPFVITSGQRPE